MPRDYEALKTMSAREYAETKNAETVAQAEAEGWTFYTVSYIPEDIDTKYPNAYEWVRVGSFGVLSDVYKDHYGVRPRGIYPSHMTLEEIEAEIEELCESARRSEEAQAIRDAEAAAKVAEATSGTALTDNPFARLLAGKV